MVGVYDMAMRVLAKASFIAATCLGTALGLGPAWAADDQPAKPDDLWSSDTLLGDFGGVRSALKPYGVTLALSETSEILGNVTGGIRQGAIYEGLTDASVQIDLRTKYGWPGVFYARGFQIHGRGLTANYVDNLNTISSIEAERSTRLFELWYEHYATDWLRVRIGQQAADQEFWISSTAKLFVNSTFGWPTLNGEDLPCGGGPAYPLATPAVRVRLDPSPELHVLAAVFNSSPAGHTTGDPQQIDPSGTAFRIGDGEFAIAEIHYHPGNTPSNGSYRFGAWYNSEQIPGQHFDTTGLSLANPASNGMPRLFNGDYAIYTSIDQPLFHAKDSDAGLSVFTRAAGAPSDRNSVDFYLDGGVSYKGPFGRDNDIIGAAFAYSRISNSVRQLDADTAFFTGQPYPVRASETVVEVSYQYQIAPWWQLQPDFQYIVRPGGGIPNPDQPTVRIGNAAVLGLRTVITF